MNKTQTGFTLIELIVVIVILGILAATALPKYMGIQSGARASILAGARGAVVSAMNIAYATQASQGILSNTGITLDGISIAMVNGYPAAGSAGSVSNVYAAAGLSADYSIVGASSAASLSIGVLNAPTATTCAFSYTAATVSGSTVIPAKAGAPVVSGC